MLPTIEFEAPATVQLVMNCPVGRMRQSAGAIPAGPHIVGWDHAAALSVEPEAALIEVQQIQCLLSGLEVHDVHDLENGLLM